MRAPTGSQCPLALSIVIVLILFILPSPQAKATVVNLSDHRNIEDVFSPKQLSELPDVLEDEASLTSSTTTSTTTGQGQPETKVLANKFLILTTGNEIKLYPLHLSSQQNSSPTTTGDYYLIKPMEFDLNEPGLLKRLGANSSFTRWLLEREGLRAARSDGSRRLSILPVRKSQQHHPTDSLNDGDEELYQGGSGWRRPWISDVDYFFNSTFCAKQTSAEKRLEGPYRSDSCLVVVWLDKRNKFVRFGSIDINEHPIEDMTVNSMASQASAHRVSTSPSTNTRDKVLWLREFPPIDICNRASELDNMHWLDCEVSELAIEKGLPELHLTIYSDILKMDRILSGQLRASTTQREQFAGLSLLALNLCAIASKARPTSGVKNLNIDDTRGSWMFYLNKHYDGRIMGLDLSARLNRGLQRTNRISHFRYAPQALVKDTQLNGCNQESSSGVKDRLGRISTMTVDTNRAKLYWLMDNHQLYSSDLAGLNVESAGKLPAKPLIRTPDVMRVFHDTIFFSDTSRKSIMTYRLNPLANQLASGDVRSNHQVLLVETPTIYGFRLIDTDIIASDDTIEVERDDSSGRVDEVQVDPAEKLSWFGECLFRECRPQEDEDVYEILTKRAHDGCDHPNLDSHYQHWNWVYYGCISFIMIATVFILTATLVLAIRVKAIKISLAPNKQDEMTNDSNPIKYSV